jgi:hypothetical protein
MITEMLIPNTLDSEFALFIRDKLEIIGVIAIRGDYLF